MALDLVGGSLFTLLYDGVKEAMVKTTQFKSLLADLKSTLDSLQPRILQQIGEHNTELGLQNQEIEDLQRQMVEGVKLVQKFSEFHAWNYCCVGDCTDQLLELDRALRRLLEMLRLQEVRDVKETLLLSRQNHDKLDEVSRKLTEIQRLLLQQQKPGDVMEATGSGNDTETVPEPIQGNGIQVAALDGGNDLEAIFGMLFYAILEVEVKAVMFKAPLGDLKSTLYSLKPLIEEIAKCNKVLVRPKEELEKLAKQIKMGVELIPKCSKVHSWASCKKSTYTERLHGLDTFLQKQLFVLKMEVAKDVRNTLVYIRNIEVVIEQIERSGVLRDQIQMEYLSDVAEPLPPTRQLEIVNLQIIKDVEEMMSIKNTKSSVKPMEESSAAQKPLQTKGTKTASKDYTFLPHIFSIFSKNIVSDTSSSAETSLFPEATKSRYQRSAGTSVFSEATTSTYDSIDDQSTDGHILETPNLRLFTFEELKKATRNFKADNLLGEGKFGRVFKGWMDGNAGTGMPVAIKRLRPEYFLGFKEWQTDVNNIARLSHPNLVKLLGCCYEGKERLVVYEYMRGGNYDNHLFRRIPNKEPVSWDNRIKIAIGAARGLAFLHSLERQNIYGEFTTSKILLDENYIAKLSNSDLHVPTWDVRLLGYCSPEYIETGHLYTKSDVYSFGVVLLDSLTGLPDSDRKRPKGQQLLVDMAKPLLSNKRQLKTIMDVHIEGQYSFKAALETAHVTLKCLARDHRSRPSMNEVVEALEHIQATK